MIQFDFEPYRMRTKCAMFAKRELRVKQREEEEKKKRKMQEMQCNLLLRVTF